MYFCEILLVFLRKEKGRGFKCQKTRPCNFIIF